MSLVTLKNLVRKSELVSKQVLTALADRIGSGSAMPVDHPPATFLSRGHFPMPRLPEPATERGSRQVVLDAMTSMPSAGIPTGPVGSASGNLARTCPSAVKPTATRTPPQAVRTSQAFARSWRQAGGGRASYPGSERSRRGIGSDCQSPDLRLDRADRNATANPRRHRTTTPTNAANK